MNNFELRKHYDYTEGSSSKHEIYEILENWVN